MIFVSDWQFFMCFIFWENFRFVPSPWLLSGHLQTIATSALRKTPHVDFERWEFYSVVDRRNDVYSEKLYMNDGGFVTLDWTSIFGEENSQKIHGEDSDHFKVIFKYFIDFFLWISLMEVYRSFEKSVKILILTRCRQSRGSRSNLVRSLKFPPSLLCTVWPAAVSFLVDFSLKFPQILWNITLIFPKHFYNHLKSSQFFGIFAQSSPKFHWNFAEIS